MLRSNMIPADFDTSRVWIGLDVGGTKIEGVAVDHREVVLGQIRRPTDTRSAEHSVESIAQALRATMDSAGVTPAQVAAVGLGIPGMVQGGVVSLAVNLKLNTFPLADYLESAFGVPILLENDVRAAALGAFDWAHQQWPTVNSLIYLSIGTGISCGVILDGRLHRGVNGMAGEIGHSIVDPGGELCKCGSRGCLETIAAGPAIARYAAQLVASGHHTSMREMHLLTTERVFEAARSGDSAARAVVRRAAVAIARAIYNLLMTYNVDLVTLGGGVAQAGEVFFGPVRDELNRIRAESPLAEKMLEGRLEPVRELPGSPAPFETQPNRLPGSKIILLPRDAVPAWRGMIVLAKGMGV